MWESHVYLVDRTGIDHTLYLTKAISMSSNWINSVSKISNKIHLLTHQYIHLGWIPRNFKILKGQIANTMTRVNSLQSFFKFQNVFMVLVIGGFYFPSCPSKSWATSFATSSSKISKCSSSISGTGIDPLFIPERLLIKSSKTAISMIGFKLYPYEF